MALSWEQAQLVRAAVAARKRMGAGWSMIGSELRAALIKAEVLSIIAAAADFEDTPQGRLATLAMRYDDED